MIAPELWRSLQTIPKLRVWDRGKRPLPPNTVPGTSSLGSAVGSFQVAALGLANKAYQAPCPPDGSGRQ